jgi:hypothetical protein
VDRPGAALIHQLVSLASELGPVYSSHLQDNYGELLPHLMMADTTRWLIMLFRRAKEGGSNSGADMAQLQTVLAFIEDQLTTGDDPARDLIGASFLENLWQADEDYDAIKELLGPSLHTWLDQMDW